MKQNKRTFLIALAGVLIFSCSIMLGAVEGDWRPLIRGDGLEGWRRINGFARFERQGDVIVGTTAAGSPNSFLCTEEEFCDFELLFEVKLDPRLNSGVQIRSKSTPAYRKGRVHGYQVEIAANGNAGFIYDEARRGWLSKDRSNPRARSAFRRDDWNRFRVLCVGDIIRTWVNGVPVAFVVDDMTHCGFIGLQVHAFKGSPPAQVRWRNLRIRTVKDKISPVIESVEKACLKRTVYMIGRTKAKRLAALVHQASPKLVVECGTALGYSGLWIARELAAQGFGRLVTIEINPERAREAEQAFRRAGLERFVTVKIGNAEEVMRTIKGPVDFLFLDCGFGNYFPCLKAVEKELAPGAVIVADNVGIGASGMSDYLDYVRKRYKSRTEWFNTKLPWSDRDAMEITVLPK